MSCRVWGVDERRVGVPHAMATLMIGAAHTWTVFHGSDTPREQVELRNGMQSARRRGESVQECAIAPLALGYTRPGSQPSCVPHGHRV